jgi:HTH-type transcriptional regulator / antitoxin HipB
MNHIGKIVRYHRKKSGLTQKELADLTGTGKTVVFDIEHGKSTVQFESLQKVCHVLNISIDLKSPLMDQCLEELKDEGS